MNPSDLADSGSRLASLEGSKRPREAELRRAVASSYSACVHALCLTVANLMIGATRDARDTEAWLQAYKAIEHGRARAICSNQEKMRRFPKEIRRFAEFFVYLQRKRFQAEYDPIVKLYRYEILTDAKEAKKVIRDFMKAPRKDRLDFVALIVFPERKKI